MEATYIQNVYTPEQFFELLSNEDKLSWLFDEEHWSIIKGNEYILIIKYQLKDPIRNKFYYQAYTRGIWGAFYYCEWDKQQPIDYKELKWRKLYGT